jgi:hypothetical protein
MHAGRRLEIEARIVGRAGVVAVDPQPLHLAPHGDLLLAHHRDVVLGRAGRDAGIAFDAEVEIDHHAPGVARGRPVQIEVRLWRGLLAQGRMRGRDLAHKIEAVHATMHLGGGQLLVAVDPLQAASRMPRFRRR